jgi:hypothetical protein
MGSIGSAVGNMWGSSIGGIVNGAASGLTPQNSFSASPEQETSQNFQPQLDQAAGNYSSNLANQNSLGAQLLAQSQGQGPNPAQMQLQQATDANNKMAAGQYASQKGINPGLGQKQIMTNAANQNQTAAGQGAVLGAQQQLAAQGQLGSLYNQIGNQALTNQNTLQTGAAAQNNASNYGTGINAGVAAQNTAAIQNTSSGIYNGIGSMMSMGGGGGGGGGMGMYKGGEVPHYDEGGDVGMGAPATPDYLGNFNFQDHSSDFLGNDDLVGAKNDAANSSIASGGSGDQSVGGGGSPGQAPNWASGMNFDPTGSEKQSSGGGGGGGGIMSMLPMLAAAAAHGGMIGSRSLPADHPVMMALKARGGPVPGTPMVEHNSPKNDTQPAMLSPGEVVLPLNVMNAKDPGAAAKMFVEQLKKSKSNKEDSGYGKVLSAKRKAGMQ